MINWKDEDLIRRAFEGATSQREIRIRLGLAEGGNSHSTIKKYATLYGLVIPNGINSAAAVAKTQFPLEQILVEHSTYVSFHNLKPRLVKAGLLEYKCSWCGCIDWLGEPIALQLDHINGVRSDNRIENLRFLCPNCHSQTRTWGRRKRI